MTDLAAAHYAGGEAYDLDSVEVKILLRTVALILRDDLAGVADEVFLKAANALLPRYGTDGIAARLAKLGTEVFGPVTPASISSWPSCHRFFMNSPLTATAWTITPGS